MSQIKPWVKALNISIADFETWSAEVSSDENITFWAMDKGKLRAQDYLHWAREHYQLPVLKDNWFKENCNYKLWNQIQTVANWSPHMLPIEEWDGLIYIACVEPPTDVQWSFPVTYVLANARSLKAHWKKLSSGAPEEINAPKVRPAAPSTPEPVAIPQPKMEAEPSAFPEPPSIELPVIPKSFESTTPDIPNVEIALGNDDEVDHLSAINIPDISDLPPAMEFTQNHDGESHTESGIHLNTPESNEVMSSDESNDVHSDTDLKIPVDFKLDLPQTPVSVESVAKQSKSAQVNMDSPEGMSMDVSLSAESFDSSPEGIQMEAPQAGAYDNNPEGMNLNFPENDGSPDGFDLSVSEESFVFNNDVSLGIPDKVSLSDDPEVNPEEHDAPPAAVFERPLSENTETSDPDESLAVSLEEPPAVEESIDFSIEQPLSKQTPEVKKPPQPAAKKPEFKIKPNQNLDPNADEDGMTPLNSENDEPQATVTRFALTLTGMNKKAPKGAVIDTDKSAPHTPESCANESEAAAWLFSEMKSHFQQTMILLFNGDELKAWKWESTWAPTTTEAFGGFNPDQPGLFRIIKRTRQPYHGYVVPSPLNKDFFKSWGFETPPEHVTALPMVLEGHLTGIILSLGDEQSNSDRALMDAQKIVKEFNAAIVRITSKAA